MRCVCGHTQAAWQFTVAFQTHSDYTSYELHLEETSYWDWTNPMNTGRTWIKSSVTTPFVVSSLSGFVTTTNPSDVTNLQDTGVRFQVKIVGVESSGAKTSSPLAKDTEGLTGIEAKAGPGAPTGVGICDMFDSTQVTSCTNAYGQQQALSVRVYFRGGAWASGDTPKTSGYVYKIQISTTNTFNVVVKEQSVAAVSDDELNQAYHAQHITGLVKAQLYYARVAAQGTLLGTWSSVSEGVVVIGAPGVPSIVTSTGVYSGPYIKLSLTAPTDTGYGDGATKKTASLGAYSVQVSSSNDFPTDASATETISIASSTVIAFVGTMQVGFLQAGSTYYVRATTTNNIAVSAYSTTVNTGPIQRVVDCPENTFLFASSQGSEACVPCPQLSVSPTLSEGNSSCKCPPGYTGPDGKPCTGCPANTYKEILGAGSCQNCPDNSLSDEKSTSIGDCTCRSGYTGSVMACTKCEAGKYKDRKGPDACSPCNAGKFNTNEGSDSVNACETCPSFSNSPESSASRDACVCNAGATGPNGETCAECTEGTYKGQAGPADCLNCPVGAYAVAKGAAQCTSCPLASTTTSEGKALQNDCKCNAGHTGTDGSNCDKCAAGKYKTQIGADVCDDCAVNKVSPEGSTAVTACVCSVGYRGSGDGSCEPCPPGTYKDVASDDDCTACPLGSNSPAGSTSSLSCAACPSGYYGSTSGRRSGCTLCPGNSTSQAGARLLNDCTCLAGYEGSAGSRCIGCVPGKYKLAGGPVTICSVQYTRQCC